MSSKKRPAERIKRFDSFYARRPIQCQYCLDFILGSTKPLKVCHDCKAVLHPICALHGHVSDCFSSMSEQQYQLQQALLSPKPIAISEWTADVVREWIAASESHRYFYVFNSKREVITGENLVDPSKVTSTFRADELHKKMLCEAIYNAQHYFPLPSDFSEAIGHKSSNSNYSHEFSKYECYSTFQCAKCNLSRGVMSYGVKCRKCGMRFHRMCKMLPRLPPCPNKFAPASEYVFGQDLSDVFSPYENKQVPLFLKLCFQVIQERLQPSDKAIYVSSAKGIRLQELCIKYGFDIFREGSGKTTVQPTVSHEGIESALKSIPNLDDLAGLLKSYLRELPNPVIPFEVYDDMIALAKKGSISDDEAKMVVEKIPPPHRFALSHILLHIEWIHDFFKGADRLGSLFAAFGTILVRPPPQSVRSLASWERGCDYHSIIVKLVYGNYRFKDISSITISSPKHSLTMGGVSTSPLASSTSGRTSFPQSIGGLLDSDSTSGSSLTPQNSDVYIQFNSLDAQPPLDPKQGRNGNYERMSQPSMERDGTSVLSSPIMTKNTKVENLPEYKLIQELPYYWTGISKDQEKMLTENENIGNFILRKSSSDPAAFTLVVKSYDFNYMVQIRNYFTPDDGWGIAAHAPKFTSIPDLIQHYQSHDLSTSPYLQHVNTSMTGEDNSRGSMESLNSSQTKYSFIRLRESINRDLRDDMSLTKQKLVTDSVEVVEHEKRIGDLKRNLSFIKDSEIPYHAKRKEALAKLCKQLRGQFDLLGTGARNLRNEDKRRLVASQDILSRRIDVAENMISECEASLEQLQNQKVNMESDLHKCSTELSAEIRQQTKRRITLELFGIPYEDDNLTDRQLFNREKMDLWFYQNSVTRDMAQRMFELCRDTAEMDKAHLVNGTFLVRTSREGGYAISVWVSGEVMHLKLQYEDKKYGFAYPYINYSGITDLVVAYTETSLVMHNHNLDTPLTTPIGQIIEDNQTVKLKIAELFGS